MITNLKVIAVNQPKGTITVMWNDDPELEWNHFIPTDENDVPLEGDQMLKALVADAYDSVVMVLKTRAEKEVRDLTDFSQFDALKRKTFSVKGMVAEYESIRKGKEEITDLPQTL